MKWLIALVIVMLNGCDMEVRTVSYTEEAGQYKCNEEQLKLVEREMEVCSKTGIFNRVCYAQAKKAHCEKIVKEGSNDNG